MNSTFQKYLLIILAVALVILNSCNDYDLKGFSPDQVEPISEIRLKQYADTSLILPGINKLKNARQQLDSLIYYAEWLKNYNEDIALFYAQKAYELATEKNWNFPRAVSAYRVAGIKGRRAIFGEDIEDAMVDAKISKRLMAPHEDIFWSIQINNLIGALFEQNNQLDSAQHYYELALLDVKNMQTDTKKINDNKALILSNLGNVVASVDSARAIDFYLHSDSLFQIVGNKKIQSRLWVSLANFYRNHQQYAKADSLYNLCLDYGQQKSDIELLSMTYQYKGESNHARYKRTRQLDFFNEANANLRKSLTHSDENLNRTYEYLGLLHHDSWANYVDDSHADSAVQYYRLAIIKSREEGAIRAVKAISKNLTSLCRYAEVNCDSMLKMSTVLFLDENYGALVDTITSHSKLAYQRINNVEQRDIREAAASKRKNQLLIGLAIFGIAVALFIFLLQGQQTRRLKAEMEALRAQINPHFISNSLNAIESLVNLGNAKAAAKYLVHFSRLSRQILNGSRSATTSLSEEIKTLNHFLVLEQLRFRDKLTFDIKVAPEVNTDLLLVPAMILQPYVENAIWHGIKPKTEGGHVQVNIFQDDKILICEIEDNGVGREKSKTMRDASVLKHKSMGMQITEERLRAMGKIKGSQVDIEDLKDEEGRPAGTKVTIKFKYQTKKSQPV